MKRRKLMLSIGAISSGLFLNKTIRDTKAINVDNFNLTENELNMKNTSGEVSRLPLKFNNLEIETKSLTTLDEDLNIEISAKNNYDESIIIYKGFIPLESADKTYTIDDFQGQEFGTFDLFNEDTLFESSFTSSNFYSDEIDKTNKTNIELYISIEHTDLEEVYSEELTVSVTKVEPDIFEDMKYYWKLDESEGDIIEDIISGFDGEAIGTEWVQDDNYVGGSAIRNDGSDSNYIKLLDSATDIPSSPATFSFTFNVEQDSDEQVLISAYPESGSSGDNRRWSLHYNKFGERRLTWRQHESSSTSDPAFESERLELNRRYRCTIRHDLENDFIDIHINNKKHDEGIISRDLNPSDSSFIAMRLGDRDQYGAEGVIDGIIVYDKFISEDKIEQDYLLQPFAEPSLLNESFLYLSAKDINKESGEKLSIWEDKSGNENHAKMDKDDERPIFRKDDFNGHESIELDGNSWLKTDEFSSKLNQPNTIFAVWSRESSGGNSWHYPTDSLTDTHRQAIGHREGDGLFMLTSDENGDWEQDEHGGLTNAPFDPIISTGVYSEEEHTLYTNGEVEVDNLNIPNSSLDGLTIGGRFSEPRLIGNVAEIIIFDYILTDYERQLITNYLKTKYSV